MWPNPAWKRYLLILVCFALGLMAKPMLVTLPLVLLLLDYWPLGRLTFNGWGRSRSCRSARPCPGPPSLPRVLILGKGPSVNPDRQSPA